MVVRHRSRDAVVIAISKAKILVLHLSGLSGGAITFIEDWSLKHVEQLREFL